MRDPNRPILGPVTVYHNDAPRTFATATELCRWLMQAQPGPIRIDGRNGATTVTPQRNWTLALVDALLRHGDVGAFRITADWRVEVDNA